MKLILFALVLLPLLLIASPLIVLIAGLFISFLYAVYSFRFDLLGIIVIIILAVMIAT